MKLLFAPGPPTASVKIRIVGLKNKKMNERSKLPFFYYVWVQLTKSKITIT
jgi:hypothetical protein